MALEVGSQAPDFTLLNENLEKVRLSDLRGHNVVLLFFPGAFSPGCTKELEDIAGLRERFDAAGGEVFGISVDGPFALKAFRESLGLEPHLLSDFEPKGAVARKYDAYFDKLGFANRATYVIDKNGTIAYEQMVTPETIRDQEEVLAALATCPV